MQINKILIGLFVITIVFLQTTSTHAAYYYLTPALHQKMNALDTTPVLSLQIPVSGVSVSELKDTWGNARSAGRKHEGIDIFATKGTRVISPTDAVVIGTGFQKNNGGTYVFTANPGDEKYYYAHLNSIASGITVGSPLKAGDTIGYVGHSGNAEGGKDHLHFGIYKQVTTAPINPFSRLTKELQIKAVEQSAVSIPTVLKTAQLPPFRILKTGTKGADVKLLQQNINTLLHLSLKADGIYGRGTVTAVKRFQKEQQLIITGIAGAVTQNKIAELLNKD